MDKTLFIVLMEKQEVQGVTEEMIKEKHESSLRQAEEAMKKGTPAIFVTNSSSGMEWAFEDYVKIANENGYNTITFDKASFDKLKSA